MTGRSARQVRFVRDYVLVVRRNVIERHFRAGEIRWLRPDHAAAVVAAGAGEDVTTWPNGTAASGS